MQNLPFALAFRGRGNSSRQNTTKTYSNRSLVPLPSSTGFPLHSWGQKTRKNKPKTRSFTFWLFLRVEETLNSFFPLYFDSATITFDVSPRRFFVFVRSRAPTLFFLFFLSPPPLLFTLANSFTKSPFSRIKQNPQILFGCGRTFRGKRNEFVYLLWRRSSL